MQLNTFEVLADPTRRSIVEALRGGERAVNDIVDAVAIHQSGVSRHLRILHESGFVRVRPDGPHRYYSLRAEPFRELDGWVVTCAREEIRALKPGESFDAARVTLHIAMRIAGKTLFDTDTSDEADELGEAPSA